MGRRPGSRNLKPSQRQLRLQAQVHGDYQFTAANQQQLADMDLPAELWQRQWRRQGQEWQVAGWQCRRCLGMFRRPGAITNHPEKCRGLPAEAADDEWLEMRLPDGRIVRKTTDK